MRKILGLLLVSVLFVAACGCMELIPPGGEMVSKIDRFDIEPPGVVIAKGNSFVINIDATVGYDINIYLQNVAIGGVQRVYSAKNSDGYDHRIKVDYKSSGMGVGSMLTSESKGWVSTGVAPVQDYLIFVKVCDFGNIPGNAQCATSNGYRIAFIN